MQCHRCLSLLSRQGRWHMRHRTSRGRTPWPHKNWTAAAPFSAIYRENLLWRASGACSSPAWRGGTVFNIHTEAGYRRPANEDFCLTTACLSVYLHVREQTLKVMPRRPVLQRRLSLHTLPICGTPQAFTAKKESSEIQLRFNDTGNCLHLQATRRRLSEAGLEQGNRLPPKVLLLTKMARNDPRPKADPRVRMAERATWW